MNPTGACADTARDKAALLDALGDSATRFAAIEVAGSIDSSNSELLRRGVEQPLPALLLALAQHAGRGRQGRTWITPAGGQLALSLACTSNRSLTQLSGLTLAAGIAIAESLAGLGAGDVRLKWPNDLLLGDAKLGGILLESRLGTAGDTPRRCLLVLGVGINRALGDAVVGSMPQSGLPATDLFAALGDATPELHVLAACVARALLDAIDEYHRFGLGAFLERFATRDALREREVLVQNADGDWISGHALGIAGDGRLRVLIDGSEVLWIAGEVKVRPR